MRENVVAVDIGNSAIKLAAESRSETVRIDVTLEAAAKIKALQEFAAGLPTSSNWLICSVDRQQTAWLLDHASDGRADDRFHVIAANEIDLPSEVGNREGLGRDRLLASWFANQQAPTGHGVIVVDAGTAVTIDWVSPSGVHEGGLIFPGMAACLTAMAAGTDALPKLSQAAIPSVQQSVQTGRSTESAMLLGVQQLHRFGIAGIIESHRIHHPETSVFVCGGSIIRLFNPVPEDWHYRPDFLTEAIFALNQVS